MNLTNKKIGAVFHDAGSANLGIYFLKKKKYKVKYNCQGPALKILNNAFRKRVKNSNLKKLLESSEIVITGTSRNNKNEFYVRKYCRQKKIVNIAIIDHWTGYLKGFSYRSELILPEYMYVFNKKSYLMATKIFRNKVKIFKKKNYFEDFIVSKIKKKNKNSNNILYILEPFDGKFEFLALDKFKEHLKKFRGKMNIKLKLHPSESKNKYKNWLKKNNSIGFSLVDEFDLSKSLSWADYVVGLESYMLVLAMKAKKKVFTLLPLNKKKFRLPFVKIQNIDKFKIL